MLLGAACTGWELEPLGSGGGGGEGGGAGGSGGGSGGDGGCEVAADCPAGGACVVPRCELGVCLVEDAAKGALCAADGGTVCDGAGSCVEWLAVGMDGAPGARGLHTAVWTGSEMIVWGGRPGPGQVLGDGGVYDPATDSWRAVSMVGAPAARHSHRAVWTGSVMVVWGGFGVSGYEAQGGVYDPARDVWTAMTTTGGPSGRTNHAMVWSGSEVLVWGGLVNVSAVGNGARYDVAGDSWAPIAGSGALSARFNTTHAWADPAMPQLPGGGMIVWGGTNTFDWLSDGRIYDPVADAWTVMSTAGSDPGGPLESASGVYAEGTLYMFGGWDGGTYFSDGYLFGPNAQPGGLWAQMSDVGAPSPRTHHVALVPEEGVMFVWGGCDGAGCVDVKGDGAIWRGGGGGTWTAVGPSGLSARRDATGVWTGSEAIVWGGRDGATSFGDGARRGIAGAGP